MKCLNLVIVFLFYALLTGCNTKGKKDHLVVENSGIVRKIILKQNDSVSVDINLDSLLRVKSIVRYNNGKIDGEGLTFYSNEKKIDIKDGSNEGHSKFFYVSGALKSEVFYAGMKPKYFGYEYWDAPVIITRRIIYFGEKGKVESIKIFDTTGNFIRDSFPRPNAEYSQE